MDRAAQIASLALEALLAEAAATPKPGLVDRANCGAHADMDFFTFQRSAAAIAPFLPVFVRTGIDHTGDASALLALLRPVGMEAERAMFARTGGVNTHKGAIFSFGVLLGAAGLALRRDEKCTAEHVLDLVKEICAGICRRHFDSLDTCGPKTKGDAAYLACGATGARGTAEAGFPLVSRIALPLYRALLDKGMSVNDALVDVLIALIGLNDDTNILSRHHLGVLHSAQATARRAEALGGMAAPEGRAAILRMDADFIEEWISPGGSADLLAVTHFLYALERAEG
ncbi:triphosphoribosyl-dephospho-CoA synthase CitG [Selenomonas sp. F0473]|uniref:triphosphoribosyl-dephospho-CoA synthase CitG n=1 Tax=Selenomonas sp. F0473 TaxID=999423 RepID=UPI00029E6AB8|nr:triphosphoribosyl-dephospho-CoA synthase CitG [Selenomonas sp. F0473]EKU70912.1 triphosphoribosyl-dephospho-CoA synthase CitG [Selenomonas sp. F0473]